MGSYNIEGQGSPFESGCVKHLFLSFFGLEFGLHFNEKFGISLLLYWCKAIHKVSKFKFSFLSGLFLSLEFYNFPLDEVGLGYLSLGRLAFLLH